jgi:hypothetical protein
VDLEDNEANSTPISSPVSIHLHKDSSLVTIEDSYAIMKSPKDARLHKRIHKTKKDTNEASEANKGGIYLIVIVLMFAKIY